MTQFKFKAGDKVKRIRSEREGMKVGDIGVVKSFENSMNMYLEGYNFAHDPENFELVVEDEKETTAKWLKENKWWIKCESALQFDLINKWLVEYYGDRSRFNPPENLKIITNFNSYGMKDYIMWNSRDDYPLESEIKFEFHTVVKSVKLPQEVKPTEQQIKIAELEQTIADAQRQIEQLKEMK